MTAPQPGQPVVFRNATVLTMDDAHTVLEQRRRARLRRADRRGRPGPRGAGGHGGDRRGRRHRHAGHGRHPPAHVADGDARVRRRLDPHPVLRLLLPAVGQDLPPARTSTRATCCRAIEAIDAGVTTSVDWSHGLRTTEHADAAVDALESVPGRFVLGYGNIFAGAWEWATTPEFRDFYTRRIDGKGDMLGFQIAFDLPGHRGLPGEGGLRRRPRPRRAGHHARRACATSPATSASTRCTTAGT